MGRRFDVAPPSADDCPMCDLPLNGALRKTRRGWVHKACLQKEQR